MITSRGLQQLGFDSRLDFTLQDNSDGQGTFIVKWMSSKPQPTEAEIETAHNEWQVEWDAQEYARKRQAEYPSINDLIVALWENVIEERAASVIELEAKRQDVKTKYPKS